MIGKQSSCLVAALCCVTSSPGVNVEVRKIIYPSFLTVLCIMYVETVLLSQLNIAMVKRRVMWILPGFNNGSDFYISFSRLLDVFFA